MICISGFLSSAIQLLFRVCLFGINKNEQSYKEFRYASINIVVIALFLGLCQQTHLKKQKAAPAFSNGVRALNFDPFNQVPFKAQFDSGIPFISGNIIIPYQILPQLYIFGTLSIRFLFEQPFDFRVLLDFYWAWFFLRFFMRSKDGAIGDFSQQFSLSVFFPSRL